MKLLISDANILIDLEEGLLLESFFTLPYQFKVPDVLFEEELKAQHSHLITLGLLLGELTPESVIYAYQLRQKYTGPSMNDCLALSLAKQEKCPLLTGDMALRNTAQEEEVELKGTLWAVEQMVSHEIINKEQALKAYGSMKAAGRRLPWSIAVRRLNEL